MRVRFIGLAEVGTNQSLEAGLQKYLNTKNKIEERLRLTLNKSYVVYGLDYSPPGRIRFLLVNNSNSYPDFYPSEFFEVIDKRISKYWVDYPQRIYSSSCVLPGDLVSFAEAKTPFFFDNLLDDKESATQIFKVIRKKMDIEFPDPTLKIASILESNWIVCAYCEEAWEASSEDGIAICPQGHANNNPLWT